MSKPTPSTTAPLSLLAEAAVTGPMPTTPPIMCETAGAGDAAVLDRLGKVEALLAGLLGVAGANQGKSQEGIMDRLTNVEKRLAILEEAIQKTQEKEPSVTSGESMENKPSSERVSHHRLLASRPAVNDEEPAVEETESTEPAHDENQPMEDEAQSEAAIHHEHCGCTDPRETHDKIKAFARKNIFKCLKFLSPKPSDLYSVQPGSVGSVVVKEFNIPENLQQSWWELHCQIVQTTIARARNNVSNDIKMTVRKLLWENPEIGSKGCKVPPMDRIRMLRGDEEAFQFLVDHIYGCVLGKREWNTLKYTRDARKELSVSDEAFAIVVLENNWNLLTMPGGRKGQPKYTGRDSVDKDDGWSRLGVARFNKLYETVMTDREAHPEVDARTKDKLFQKDYQKRVSLFQQDYTERVVLQGNKRRREEEEQDEARDDVMQNKEKSYKTMAV